MSFRASKFMFADLKGKKSPWFPLVCIQGDEVPVVRSLISPLILMFPFYYGPKNLAEHLFVWVLVWTSISKLNYILHNHVHAPMAGGRLLNRWIDLSLGFCTGMTAMSWRITHLHGHHCEHLVRATEGKRAFLPSRAPLTHVRHDGYLSRFTIGNVIRHCFLTAAPQWWRPVAVAWEKGVRRPKAFSAPYYRWALAEFSIVYMFYALLLLTDPFTTVIYVLLPIFLVLVFSRYIDYMTHVGEKRGRPSFANNCLSNIYNRLYWNFGHHAVHHIAPTLHWTVLPSAHERLSSIFPHLASSPSTPPLTHSFSGALWPIHLWSAWRCSATAAHSPSN
jgi:Fatty acid desaturase